MTDILTLSVAVSKALRTAKGMEIVDRVRTVRDHLGSEELNKLVDLGHALDPSITPLILENLVPGQADVWQSLDVRPSSSQLRSQ